MILYPIQNNNDCQQIIEILVKIIDVQVCWIKN